jgi:hypothetical protein
MDRSEKIRVLIADDSALMRQKLRQIVEADPELEVVGVARDGEDAIAKARELRPAVVSLDINMPKLDGVGVSCQPALFVSDRSHGLAQRTRFLFAATGSGTGERRTHSPGVPGHPHAEGFGRNRGPGTTVAFRPSGGGGI